MMKKGTAVLTGILMVVLLFVSGSALAAQPGNPGAINCDMDITYNGIRWEGTVWGPDCSVAGAIMFEAVDSEYRFRPTEDNFSTMHFVEDFTICPGSDLENCESWIKGRNCGLWNFKSTLKYRAHGWVTDVSDDLSQALKGSQYHEMGTTTPLIPGEPVFAPESKMSIVPGNRPVDSAELCAPPEEPGEE